jgi:osmotically inducible protein OsmC
LRSIKEETMPVRKANAVWEGSLKEGQGTMKLGSGAFEGRYSFGSRFEEAAGTNPEELIGAAHAGCFSMALSGGLGRAGFTPKRVATVAKVHIEKVGEGFKITRIELDNESAVPGIDEAAFQDAARKAKEGCPVSQALGGVEITLTARLVS